MTMTTSNNSTAVPAIQMTGVSKRFRTPKGGVFTALRDFDLTIAPGEFCAVVDSRGAFDPLSASRVGVDLRRLLWVRAGNRIDLAFKAADLILHAGGFGVVVLDLCDKKG